MAKEKTPITDLKTLFDQSTLVDRGLCPVSQIQGDTSATSHSLYYEQHGRGPEKIVFIVGLNNTSFAWESQVKYFAPIEKYSVLVFDNRGVGNSDAPRGPYSTSSMAEDVITLVNYLGWTEERQLHIVGLSLGGMIALELATRIPQRMASLTLFVTTAGNNPRPFGNLAPRRGTRGLVRTMGMKDPKEKIGHILDMIYPETYLNRMNPEDPAGGTFRDLQTKAYLRRISYTRPQSLLGSLSQMWAALFHYVSPDRLAEINASIPKILILTGDNDHMVDPSNSFKLAAAMPDAEFVQWEETGHGIVAQWPKRVAHVLQRVFEEGSEKVKAELEAVEVAGTL